jgi:soluble lytic murein transglycosylase-like protein
VKYRGPQSAFLLCLVLASRAAFADIFMFVDASGAVHYSDVPDDPRYEVVARTPAREGEQPQPVPGLAPGATPTAYDAAIHVASAAAEVPPALVRAVITVESGFNPRAQSRAGAKGLMQLMPETARRYGVSDAFDPEQNIQGGTRYLADLIARFGRENLELVLAAYNAGETAVAKYGNRIPPYRETLHYVPNVIRLFRALSARETRTAGG